jgi:hypothetical protein
MSGEDQTVFSELVSTLVKGGAAVTLVEARKFMAKLDLLEEKEFCEFVRLMQKWMAVR